MANTIDIDIQDGERNVIVDLAITGDSSGDESATSLLDISADLTLSQSARDDYTEVKLMRAQGGGPFRLAVLWDATTDVVATVFPDNEFVDIDFRRDGGRLNTAGAGKTGDVLFTTTGLATETGHYRLWFQKR